MERNEQNSSHENSAKSPPHLGSAWKRQTMRWNPGAAFRPKLLAIANRSSMESCDLVGEGGGWEEGGEEDEEEEGVKWKLRGSRGEAVSR